MVSGHTLARPDESITLDENTKDIEILSSVQKAEINIPEHVTGATLKVTTVVNQAGQREATLPQMNVKASAQIDGAAVEIRVEIPAGAKVTGSADWDGTINLPEVLPNSSVSVSGGNIKAVVEIGLPDGNCPSTSR